jgi:hypothetical protein
MTTPQSDLIGTYLEVLDELTDNKDQAEALAAMNAAFGVGLLMGAGYPGTAATVEHLLKKAYPKAPFPLIEKYRTR